MLAIFPGRLTSRCRYRFLTILPSTTGIATTNDVNLGCETTCSFFVVPSAAVGLKWVSEGARERESERALCEPV